MTDWLLHTLVATSALIVLVLVVREPARKGFGSRVTYGLWLIPAARVFMPTLSRTVERSVPAVPLFRSLVSNPQAMTPLATRAPSFPELIGGWSSVAIFIWLGGAAVLFLSRMIAFHRDRQAILAASSARVTRLGSVRLVRSPEILSPVALGILRPMIAVPAEFERLYAKRERRLVLQHELAHHRSGDLVANLFAFVLLCLQWFNPLAWVAHSAFRFDQEAACDARVLDKAPAADRANYGRAIAKAASGRALLFASALDRPTVLQRRLQSMLSFPTPTRRLAGRLLIIGAVAFALPLTAGRAIAYVGASASTAQVAPTATLRPIASTAAVVAAHAARPAPAAPAQVRRVSSATRDSSGTMSERGRDTTINDDFVTIDGTRKRLEDLTPAELARITGAVAKAQTALANTHVDQAKLLRDLAKLPDQSRLERLQGQLAAVRGQTREALHRTSEARSAGQSDELEAVISERPESLRDADFQAVLKALGKIDRQKVVAEVAGVPNALAQARAELERIQARTGDDAQR